MTSTNLPKGRRLLSVKKSSYLPDNAETYSSDFESSSDWDDKNDPNYMNLEQNNERFKQLPENVQQIMIKAKSR